MKIVFTLGLTFVMVIILNACSSNGNDSFKANGSTPVNENSMKEQVNEANDSNDEISQETEVDDDSSHVAEDVRIKLTFNNEEVIVKMYDTPASRDFLTLLPLTLEFEDYVGKEKISFLPKRLSIEEAPSVNSPSIGDFAYFSPWGNLAIFYNESTNATNDLLILGNIESGKEKLESMSSDFNVTIEKID